MLTIRRLGYALGAEVTGLDLSQEPSDETVAEIRRAWLDNVVLCFREQRLDEERQFAFCARFGALEPTGAGNLTVRRDLPEVHFIVSKPVVIGGTEFRSAFADEWHSDQSYTIHPGVATFLHAVELPEVGGDTLFASMYAAYETLSPKLREILESLEGIHDGSISNDFRRQSPEVQAERRQRNPPVVHPLVRIHPETGRKSLFVGSRLRRFKGMTDEESRPLIDFLNAHAVRYEFVYRHRWRPGDLLMWDNRCSMHYALRDYDPRQMRRMQRCVQDAPESGYVYAGEAAVATVAG